MIQEEGKYSLKTKVNDGFASLLRFGTSVITLEGVQVSILDQDDLLF